LKSIAPSHLFQNRLAYFVCIVERRGASFSPALDETFADGPVVLEVKTDPEAPPLPPHITLQRAKKFTETLIKGDPREGSVIAGTARQVLETILPGADRDNG
jgi:pyruvate dehydrogenase (quinone)